MERHTAERAGLRGLRLSSKGKRPVSSWWAVTPAAHTSMAGVMREESCSGAMNLDKAGIVVNARTSQLHYGSVPSYGSVLQQLHNIGLLTC